MSICSGTEGIWKRKSNSRRQPRKIRTFALAFSRLAQAYSSLGYDSEAEQSAKKAVALSQDLPAAEKYLISAIGLQVVKNYPEAIKAYENLAQGCAG